MRFVVKKTTKCGWWDLLCPYSCRGCGALGAVVCECCKNNLIQPEMVICPLCKHTHVAEKGAILTVQDYYCADCGLGLEAVFVGGWKEGLLSDLVKEYKYQSVRAIADVLVDLLDERLPQDLGVNITIVPLPTIGKHVRQRGFDHTRSLAKKLAKRRGWECERMLVRAKDSVQVGTKAAVRSEQAKQAYALAHAIDSQRTYLLLDDVWTTGASMLAAAEVMRMAGAKHLMAAVLVTGKAVEENMAQ